jgi:indolepyruvate ferredoxin oxidoreductase alpha subunit
VIIARRHCNLLPEEKAREHAAYRVDPEECIVCEDCFETGCPALVWQDDLPYIRNWECVGCSMCSQLCPVDAIGLVEEA